MHPTVRAVLDEAKSPTYVEAADVQKVLQPLLRLATDLQQQIAEHQQKLLDVETTPEAAHHMGRLEKLHQTLGAMDRTVKAFVAAGRELNISMQQYQRYATEIGAQLATGGDTAAP